mmetsp:Transcript_139152/g.242152  ORF Transcript_139152/g.242152 Transcript_139152/m.242152 type:complete len:277 (+) Transcript_139152:61-891(+)
MAVIVKNTFLDVIVPKDESLEEVCNRRSSSVPPTWKPCHHSKDHAYGNAASLLSDASTVASEDEEAASADHPDDTNTDDDATVRAFECSVCDAPPVCDTPQECKKILCLDACVVKTKTRLSPKTLSFVPQAQRCVPEEVFALVQSLETFLRALPDVMSVKVSECAMGATTTLLAEVASHSLGHALIPEMVNSAKSTLLDFSVQSDSLYVLGYSSQPFQDIAGGFKATVGCVSSQMESAVCWDVYEKGCCPRRNTCRWHHPYSTELMQVVLKIQDVS